MTPYSGLFSWVEIFVKSWKRPSELNFVGLNFVCDIILSLADNIMLTLNLGHAMRILTLTRNAYPDSRRKESGYTRLEEGWSASVSCLAWEAIMFTKHELHCTPE